MIVFEGKVVGKLKFDGLDISIEDKAGTYRSGTNHLGEKWRRKVTATYGYILGTNSPDGENLDVWVRPKPVEGSKVYVIHQLTSDGKKYDEDKVMLGFPKKSEAIKVFKENCWKPKEMFGGCTEYDIESFKIIAYMSSNSKTMLASQKMYDDFVDKKLMPRGIKSPIATAKIVKEGIEIVDNVLTESIVLAIVQPPVAVSEPRTTLDLSNIVWKMTNTFIKYPNEHPIDILKFTADKYFDGDDQFICNFIKAKTCCSYEVFANIVRETHVDNMSFETFSDILENTDTIQGTMQGFLENSFRVACSGD